MQAAITCYARCHYVKMVILFPKVRSKMKSPFLSDIGESDSIREFYFIVDLSLYSEQTKIQFYDVLS